jgi:acetylornithine deacetylase/succinyl-diaminopimelate desuccinylase-like protein
MTLSELSPFSDWYQKHEASIFEDFFTFLRFQSISTDPAYEPHVRNCSEWLKKYLQSIGLHVELWETPKHPVIFASHLEAGDKRPTLLIYHHYDVQPVDPINLWDSDPFHPVIREGNVYARGASDNKGQCFYSIMAIKAFLELSKKFNFNLKVCIEGEEECGSVGLSSILEKKKEALRADYLFVVDTDILAPDVPAITLGVRGLVTMHIECRGSAVDLHSGSHGGIAFNPNRALVELLSKLWDKNGKVDIPGFYDDVHPISEKEKKMIDLDFDLPHYMKTFGVGSFGGEKGLSPSECNCLRPTIEINGISGGYVGPGFKTVIPAVAVANLSCRLVPHQDPGKIGKCVVDFLREKVEKGIELKAEIEHGGEAIRVSYDTEIVKIVAQSFSDVFGKKCLYRLSGGSIPITVKLARISHAKPLFIGVALAEDSIHSPNEHFAVQRLKMGFLTMVRIFQKIDRTLVTQEV